MITFIDLLKEAVAARATELHLATNSAPQFVVNGSFCRSRIPWLTSDEIKQILGPVIDAHRKEQLEHDCAFSLLVRGLIRCEISIHYDYFGGLHCTAKLLPFEIPDHVPKVLIGRIRPGLHIVGGDPNYESSSVIASLVDHCNRTRSCKIVVISRLHHFMHSHKNSIIDHIVVKDQKSIEQAFDLAVEKSCARVLAIDGLFDRTALEAMLMGARRGLIVFGSYHGSHTIALIENLLACFPASERLRYCREFARLTNWFYTSIVISGQNKLEVPLAEVLFGTSNVREMLGADRLDNVKRILMSDDPASGHVCLRESIRLAIAKRWLTAKEATRSLEEDYGIAPEL
jgi:twitching motility protein PilT